MPIAGIEPSGPIGLPEKLKQVQQLMSENDYRAERIYQTIGTYLGYAVAHYTDFYQIQHVLILGRVTSGPGSDLILDGARKVLASEFPELSDTIQFHTLDEKEKRHGQAVAAASLPELKS